jgi:RimJ/RimL family protein N-acetyltransferase
MNLDGNLETERLILRCLDPEEVGDEYVGWLNDPAVNRYMEVRFTRQDVAGVRRFVRDANASASELLLGIFLKTTPTAAAHIGNIKIGPISAPHQRADVGLVIGAAAHRGKGYASEAIEAATRYACEKLGLIKLTAGLYAANIACYRAFFRAGYVEEARLKGHSASGEGRDDVILLAYWLTWRGPPGRN